MKRILVVYNPRSSQFGKVRQEVLDKLVRIKGCLVGKYEVEKTGIDKNVEKLAGILLDDDLVIAAGGDATGVIAANAIMRSGKDATLAALPYGNFNDLARTLGVKSVDNILTGPSLNSKIYPLEIWVDGEMVRYATCYVTVGMMAESVKIYDKPKVRKKLKTRLGRKIGSYTAVAGWYFKNRKKKCFMPKFTLNGKVMNDSTSDYVAVNGRYVARLMKGGSDYKKTKTFRSGAYELTKFWRLFGFMSKSIIFQVPGAETQGDKLDFMEPVNVSIQAEGESIDLKGVHRIEIKKSQKYLRVIVL